MNKRKILLLAALTMLVACSKDDEPEMQALQQSGQEMFVADKGEIVLQMIHPNALTRATETAFEHTDSIGVFVTVQDAALQIAGNVVNNELFTYNGTSWSSKRKVYWNEGAHNVYAYYPYAKRVSDVSDYPFQVLADQSTSWGLTHSDFLWASKAGVEASANPVDMQFAHKLSKVVVVLQKGENYTGDIPEETEVYVHSTVTKALVDLSTGDVAKDDYAGTGSIRAFQSSATQYTAIVVPQNITTRRPLVEVVTGGVSYLMEGRISLKPGMQHTLTVTLDKNPEQTKIDIGGEIVGW